MKDHVDGDLVSAVRRSCERSGVPGTVLAIATDDDVQDVAVGMAAIETVEEMRPDHQFPTMSLAKSMTAVMLLELAGTGAVRFDEPIGERIAALEDAPWAAEVTVDHLLTCTGGIPAFALSDTGESDDAIANFPLHLCDEVLVHPPGERFSYSHSSFSLAVAIAEAVAGDLYGGEPPRVCWRLSCARVSSGQLA